MRWFITGTEKEYLAETLSFLNNVITDEKVEFNRITDISNSLLEDKDIINVNLDSPSMDYYMYILEEIDKLGEKLNNHLDERRKILNVIREKGIKLS